MGEFMEVGASGTRSACPVGVERVVCCLMNRANEFAAGGLLTKFIKRGLEASQCAAVGPYMEAAKQNSSKAKRGGSKERREEGWALSVRLEAK